jgi:transposase-like protein
MQPEPSIQPSPIVTYQDYSVDRKAEVIALVEANNGNVWKTAQQTGIHHSTIQYWLASPNKFADIQHAKRIELTEKLDKTADLLVDSITPEKIADANLSQIATAAGIMIDKSQLLKGLPTDISASIEKVELTVVLQDALRDVIDITPE